MTPPQAEAILAMSAELAELRRHYDQARADALALLRQLDAVNVAIDQAECAPLNGADGRLLTAAERVALLVGQFVDLRALKESLVRLAPENPIDGELEDCDAVEPSGDRFICCRVKGHSGMHAAYALGGVLCTVWEAEHGR